MKSCCLLLLFSFFISWKALAQDGRVGLGIRTTLDGGGVTLRYFLDQSLALEGMLNVGGALNLEGNSLTNVLLLEYHFALPDPKMRIFFGGGLHFGLWNGQSRDKPDAFIAGVSGIGGIELRLPKIPLSLTIDFKPALNFINETRFFAHNNFGVGGRYIFGKRILHPVLE